MNSTTIIIGRIYNDNIRRKMAYIIKVCVITTAILDSNTIIMKCFVRDFVKAYVTDSKVGACIKTPSVTSCLWYIDDRMCFLWK